MPPSKNPWHWALAACLGLGLLPAFGAFHSARHFVTERLGEPEDEQLARLRQPWTQPTFLALAETLREVLPSDAKVLMTPTAGNDDKGKSRWFLFLADALYPRQVYVRHPAPASGTLMDYPEWVAYHFEVLGTDGRMLDFAGALRREEEETKIAAEVARLGIEWEFTYRADTKQPFLGATLLHNGEVVALDVDARPMGSFEDEDGQAIAEDGAGDPGAEAGQ